MLSTSYPTQVTPMGFPRGTFIEDFARLLVTQGHRVHILTHGDNKKTIFRNGIIIHQFKVSPRFITISENGIPEIGFDSKSLILLFTYFIKFQILSLKVIQREKIDFIWAHWLVPLGVIALVAAKIFKISYAVTCYGAELVPLIKNSNKLLIKGTFLICKESSQLICISSDTLQRLLKFCNFKGDLVPDAIDTSKYRPLNESFRKVHRISNDLVLIGFSGRMVERKGHKILIEAANIIIARGYTKVLFIIGGDGPLKPELEALVSETSQKFLFPGFVQTASMVEFLNALDLYVLPSIIDSKGDGEGSATAALEAMACGTSAIVSKSAGNVGSIIENQGGWYFMEGNSTDLADKIEILLRNPSSLGIQGVKARKFVVENYSWDVTATRLKVER
jgi:glycosyltransferase involved in cell wall biosynthesis